MTSTNGTRRIYRAAILAGFIGMLMAVSPGSARADQEGAGHHLVGAWSIQVTIRNCDTNAPMGSFFSLVSFHRGGTLSESTSSLTFQTGQRTDGHGAWKQMRGHVFSQHMIALIRFTSPANLPGTPTFDPSQPVSPGFLAGSQTVSHRVRLTGADTLESAGTNAFFDVNGQMYRTGCSTAVGRRFK